MRAPRPLWTGQPGFNKDMPPDISFVILSWNSAHFLDGCLNSLQTDLSGSGLTYEAILIDNGSKDGSLEKLRSFQREGHPLVVIPLGQNTGTTFSRNIGLRMARGKYICILDSDIVFCEANTMKNMIKVLDREPRAGIISPMLRYPSGNHQKSFDTFPSIQNKLKRLFFLRKMEQFEGLQQFHAKNLIQVDYTISAFWLFNRGLMDAIGLLDERIFYAPEDVDYCLRSWLGGYPVMFCSEVKVIHLAQEISRKKPFSKSAWRHLQGLAYFFGKYRYCFRSVELHRRIQAAVAAKDKALLAQVERVIEVAAKPAVSAATVATAVDAPSAPSETLASTAKDTTSPG